VSEALAWVSANGQIDLGSLALGIAIVVIALMSLRIARKAEKKNDNRWLSEYRQEALADIREHIARFVGTAHQIKAIAVAPLESGQASTSMFHASDYEKERSIALSQLNAELMRLEAYIRLVVDQSKDAAQLVEHLAQTHSAVAALSIHKTGDLSQQVDNLLERLMALAGTMLSAERSDIEALLRGSR
jgi:hypothetical protein